MTDKPTNKQIMMKVFGSTAFDMSCALAFVAAVGGVAYLAINRMDAELQKDNLKITLKNPTMADRCMQDVLDNDGLLRLPLPAWEQEARTTYNLRYIANEKVAETAAQLPAETIARCEDLTGTKHNAEAWAPLLSQRP